MHIKAAATMSLSATGSRKAPNGDVTLSLRARYPSRKSVSDAKTNTYNADCIFPHNNKRIQLAALINLRDRQTSLERKYDTKTGTARTRMVVIKFGIFSFENIEL
jgi:hypothetical protein